MSLKAFHIVFVIASVLVSLSFSAWGFYQYSTTDERLNIVFGVSGLAAAIALVIYGKIVLRKMRNISYL